MKMTPPECVVDGVPPCPTCPKQTQCAWAKKVLITNARQLERKMAGRIGADVEEDDERY